MTPLFFFVVVLVSGTGESVPSTEGSDFQIFVEPNIVDDLAFVPDQGLFFTISPNSNEETLLVKIPKNFPILTTIDDTDYAQMLSMGDYMELPTDMTEDDCFFNYTISVQNSSYMQLLYSYKSIHEPYLTSMAVDEDCFKKVFGDKECGPEHELQYNYRFEQVCVFPSSVEKLLARGYLMNSS